MSVARTFLRAFGAVYVVVFVSLTVQVQALIGSDGLLPVREFLAAHRADGWIRFLRLPTLFWIWDGDAAIRIGAILGIALGIGLVLGWRSKSCLVGLWLLFLSYVTVGRDFFWFQWDTLLLEATALALLLPASANRPPHPVVVFLFRWLVFRLLFESGLAKVQAGAQSWFPLTAMAYYYETAPLPSLGGWYAHQLPLWIHRCTGAMTLLGELVAPLLIWGPPLARRAAFFGILGFDVMIQATANYGYFNILSAVLALFILDDRDLSFVRRLERLSKFPGALRRRGASGAPLDSASGLDPEEPNEGHLASRIGTGASRWLVGAVGGIIFALTLIELLVLVAGAGVAASPIVSAIRAAYSPFRLASKYHLFAHIDPRRVEAEIEWTADGSVWRSYELRYKPGDVRRPPPIVAPHQPRLDFQLWFFTLGRDGGDHPYFNNLVFRLCTGSAGVQRLFRSPSLPEALPIAIRVAFYRYRMTDLATHALDGRYWTRELLDYHPQAYFCDSREPPKF